jgi:N-glycosylase/DNA lyase
MTTTITIRLAPLSLTQTFGCGQTFRWRPLADGSWRGPLRDQLVTLTSVGPHLKIESFPGDAGIDRLVSEHLRAGDDVNSIQKKLSVRDPVLARGIRDLRGLRIVKMDEWECLLSFTLATYANIPRISRMIDTLARNYGKRISESTYSFPTLSQMRKATLADLSECGLGYRAKYVYSICQRLTEDDLRRLKGLSYDDLRAELIALPGVGNKVADCVALFGFGRLESFPIDVWIERALKRLYGVEGSYGKLSAFAHKKFGGYAGYAQEYMYYNERAHAHDGVCLFSEE